MWNILTIPEENIVSSVSKQVHKSIAYILISIRDCMLPGKEKWLCFDYANHDFLQFILYIPPFVFRSAWKIIRCSGREDFNPTGKQRLTCSFGHSVLIIISSTTSLRCFSNSWASGKPRVGGEDPIPAREPRSSSRAELWGDWKLLSPEAARQELIKTLCGSLHEVYESTGHNRLWMRAHVQKRSI